MPLASPGQTIYTSYAFTNFAGVAGVPGTNDGAGNVARFDSPGSVTMDINGNAYVADVGSSTIRKITPGGVVTTLAGSAGQTGTNDGSGSAARFNNPAGVAVDAAANVYVADSINDTIRKITPAGVVTTLAGSPGQSGTNDGSGSGARFSLPLGVAVDAAANVYVADSINYTIRKITPAGVVTTLAGSAGQSGTNDGSGSAARFFLPRGVAVDSAASVYPSIYVAEFGNQTIRKITPDGAVRTLAGTAGQTGANDGIGSAAQFSSPAGVAVDLNGNVYVADTGNSTIRKITPDGVVRTLAGCSTCPVGSADGIGSAARFNLPYGVAADTAGNVYVADSGNDMIREGFPAASTSNLSLALFPPGPISIVAPTNTLNLQAIIANNTSALTFQWCKASGADQVVFTDPTSSTTTVIFGFTGTYVLSVTATDGTNTAPSASVTVTVELNPKGVFTNVTAFLSDTAPDETGNPNKFLAYGGVFGGVPNTNDDLTASNYYAAIDPGDKKATLAAWKTENGIPTNDIPPFTNGTVVSATYFNTGDLGLGRRMIMGGTNAFPAFAVSNFKNVEDAISGSNLIATVAMEYSLGTNGGTFTKFYVFSNDVNQTRVTAARLDGGGFKSVPGLCIVCHGGSNTTQAAPYPNAGNVHAHFLPFDLRSFDFSCQTNFSQSAQEAAFKSLNGGVRNIELSFATNDPSWQRPAISNLIEGWYGGAQLTNATQNVNFVPDGWKDSTNSSVLSLAGQSNLYLNVVAPSCRSCHVTRPNSLFGDLDFDNFTDFTGIMKAFIRGAVFGTNDLTNPQIALNDTFTGYPSGAIRMPAARRTFERFWNSIGPRPQAEILRDYLLDQLTNSPPINSITAVEKISNDVRISFTTFTNFGYRIEQTDELTNPPGWLPINGSISGTGGTNQIIEPIQADHPKRFYRVVGFQ